MNYALPAAAIILGGIVTADAAVDLPPEVTDGFYVTLEEVRANSAALFDAFAGPDGGPISRREFISTDLPDKIVPQQHEGQLLERLFSALDANGDGQLTWVEWDQRISMDLEFADQDEDGRITLKELANAPENLGIGEALGLFF